MRNLYALTTFFFFLSLGSTYSQNKIVKYTDEKGWKQQILYYLTPKGKEYARVYLSLDKKDISRDSLAFYKTGIKRCISENPKRLKGEYFLLQHINSIDGWDNLFYDNALIKNIIGERKVKANELFFDNQLEFETALFGRSSYTNYYSNTGLPFESDRNYKNIAWVKIKFNEKKKPIRLELLLKKDPKMTNPIYKDFYYIREYFYNNNIISKIITTIKEVGGETRKYTETYEVI